MKAHHILKMLDDGNQDELRKEAEAELKQDAQRQAGCHTLIKRQRAAEKYLTHKCRVGTVWEENGAQCFTNGHSGFMLTSKLELPNRSYPPFKMAQRFRSPPGKEVFIDWDMVQLEIERKKGAQENKKPIIAVAGGVYINLRYVTAVKAILGSNDIRVYHGGKRAPLQFECENGKAIVMPIIMMQEEEQFAVYITEHEPEAIPA